MEVELLLVVQDQDGVIYRQNAGTYAYEMTIKELSTVITSFWGIHQEEQELYYNGKQIVSRLSTLKQLGLKNDDEIVIKHSYLAQWSAYVYRVEEFKNAQISETRKDSAENAQRFYDQLRKSSFFSIYPIFDTAAAKHHKSISKFLDKRTRWIQNAAINFFTLSMFKGQSPAIEFEETNDGTRAAVICKVTVNSITHKYRIKTPHNAGESGHASRWNLDLIEPYCYKLLESIGLGPKIVFIPNIVASRSILYIGSEWLTHFRPFNSTEHVNTTEISHAVVQIHFLAVFLSLGDMHEENFGFNASSDPIILDFMMSNYGVPKHKFLHEKNTINSFRARDILENCDSAARLQIAQDAIRNWNLLDKLGEVLKLMDKEMENFGRNKLDFDKKTRDLEEYVEKVRSNIQDLYQSTL
uniref:Ubiquitin-like domain-containing protein n=1 Tax=Panagrellus redivivus TaxID=6233 RepID=A0A7E4VL82_PANRE